jgi:flavin reductase (DIM6/NTAB) family NADH-FMN oxidoreductase RutF
MKKSLGAKTVIYPTPVFVVGTFDKLGQPNAATAAWGGICCSRPPCVAVSFRKATYTYKNIVERQAFTINIPSEEYVKEADYFGLASGENENKFVTTGLTPIKSELVDAPYVAEFPFALECRLLHTIEIGLHTQFIGEVLGIKADESVLTEDGSLDIQRVKPIMFAPDDRAYYGVGPYLGPAFSIGKSISGRA